MSTVAPHSILVLSTNGHSQPDMDTVTVSVLMTVDTANDRGEVCSAALIAISTRVATACAQRYSRSTDSLKSIDGVRVHAPVRIGQLVTFFASASREILSNIRVDVRAISYDPEVGDSSPTHTAHMTFGEEDTPERRAGCRDDDAECCCASRT